MRVLRSKLAPRMVLEEAAIDREHRMLIGAQTILTERFLDVLETARIPIVYVTGASYEKNKTCADLPKLTAEQKATINKRFQHADVTGTFAYAVFNETLNHTREAIAEDSEAAK